jgi:pimeloyl-ACP methyl ester carboxylesterase
MAGEHPEKVRRVILVGSAPFRARYAAEIRRRRRERLGPEAGKEFDELERRLRARTGRPSSRVLRRLGALAGVADSYELIPHTASRVETDSKAFRAVWAEAEALRRSGALVRSLRRVRSPVLVIHGTRDSHPLSGVVEPLRTVGVKLRVVALPRCGHEPWRERHARERFFAVLRDELAKAERHEPA